MRGVARYQESDLAGASNEDLVLRLLEKAVQHELAADQAMAEGHPAEWHRRLHLARAIILELATSFDRTVAPEIANPVLTTYRWILHHLIEAGRTGDRARLQQVRETTEKMLATWTEAIRIDRAGPFTEATA